MNEYHEWIAQKRAHRHEAGFPAPDLGAHLFPFQRDIVSWASLKGRAAIFADCGLGKTAMQLEWARLVAQHTGRDVLILAPLAVGRQTAAEAVKFGVEANLVREPADWRPGINVTNYERAARFPLGELGGLVLDESSILKSFTGRYRAELTEAGSVVPYRLAATATPAPNDHMELGNHAEFLGVCTATEMLAEYFVHDGGDTSKWRLKGHAEDAFWRWVASWAIAIRSPRDLGYDAAGFDLPALEQGITYLDSAPTAGRLFGAEISTLSERRAARRGSLSDRVARVAEIVAREPAEPWVVWCELNDEADALTDAIPGARQVSGADDPDVKAVTFEAFASGSLRVIVTKPKIGGFGLNWQHCARMAFCGLSDSYEAFYQSIRRCWRFGQRRPVRVEIVVSDREHVVVENVLRKERDAAAMSEAMVNSMRGHMNAGAKAKPYATESANGEGWTLHLGDCVEGVKSLADGSVDLSVFSPPFASLYTYSDSERDMGNCKGPDEFARHFSYLVPDLFRVTKPGRLAAIHCMQLPTSKFRDGYIGLSDFRGELIRMFCDAGWIYHSEVAIWKDPVTAMQRTKALGLLYKQVRKDSCMSRQGIADYLVVMRKPGENSEPVTHTHDEFPVDLWQRWASPVWMDINPSDTLQAESARDDEDERHICPLQLPVIERAIRLWSNPGDLVLSPFAGIGSEGYRAIQCGRRFVGFELKRSYYDQARKNLAAAVESTRQRSLFA